MAKERRVKVFKSGNSLALRLPKSLGMEEGDDVILSSHLEGKLAMNFLMDRSDENWRKTLAELKAQTGECPNAEPLAPTGAMSADFKLICEKGRIEGQILLAPTTPQTMQALRLRALPLN